MGSTRNRAPVPGLRNPRQQRLQHQPAEEALPKLGAFPVSIMQKEVPCVNQAKIDVWGFSRIPVAQCPWFLLLSLGRAQPFKVKYLKTGCQSFFPSWKSSGHLSYRVGYVRYRDSRASLPLSGTWRNGPLKREMHFQVLFRSCYVSGREGNCSAMVASHFSCL